MLSRLIGRHRASPPARRICVLHAGLPKTGSSALQHFLSHNARQLRRCGILYPKAGRTRPASVEHGRLMREIAGRPFFEKTGFMPDQLDREIRRVPHELLLISSEFLFGPLFFHPDPRLPAFFRARGYALHLVLYLRDQPEHLNSAYAQQVKTAREGEGIDAYIARRLTLSPPPSGNFSDLRHLLAAELPGRQHFRPYNAALRQSGVEADFLALLQRICAAEGVAERLVGSDASRFRPVARVNETCGPVQVAVARAVSRRLSPRFKRLEWLRASVGIEAIIATSVAAACGREPAYSAMTAARYAHIRAQLARHNDRFARKCWQTSWAEMFPARAPCTLQSNDLDDIQNADQTALAAALVEDLMPKIEAHIDQRIRKGLV
ncbi:MAG: hypothetical protein AAGC92_15640 [Pseudomonadota bacterium]